MSSVRVCGDADGCGACSGSASASRRTLGSTRCLTGCRGRTISSDKTGLETINVKIQKQRLLVDMSEILLLVLVQFVQRQKRNRRSIASKLISRKGLVSAWAFQGQREFVKISI